VKKRTKRPPKPEKKEPEKHIDNADPRTLAVVDEVMRRSQQGFGKFGQAEDDDDESEEDKSDANSMALVAFDEVGQRKKNREQLKAKAKAFASKEPTKVGKIIFDVDADHAANDDDGTFVTGVGIPGKKKNKR